MKIPCNEYSSNNAQENYRSTGLVRKINRALLECLGGTISDFVEAAASSVTVGEFLNGLPYQESRADWEDAAREAWADIQSAKSDPDGNEWATYVAEPK